MAATTKLGHFYYSGVKRSQYLLQEIEKINYTFNRTGGIDPVGPVSGEANSRIYHIAPDKH